MSGYGPLHLQTPRQLGEYWTKDNASFEASNPTLIERFGRYTDPRASFGSAIGTVYERAGNGDIPGVALGFVEGMPLGIFARNTLIAGQGLIKSKTIPYDWKNFSKALSATTAIGAAGDMYDTPIDISFGSPSKNNSATYGRAAQ